MAENIYNVILFKLVFLVTLDESVFFSVIIMALIFLINYNILLFVFDYKIQKHKKKLFWNKID